MKIKFLTLLFSLLAFVIGAQTSLKGKVTDKETGEAILFGSVTLYKGNTLLTGTETDIDGNYIFKDLQPGIYTIEVNYIGYIVTRMKDFEVKAATVNSLNLQMGTGSAICYPVYPIFRTPLIEIDNTTSGHIFDSSWIRRSATRGY